MKSTELPLLAVSCYQVKLQAKESARLPVYLGSTIRGAFGHALKDTVCIVNHRDCSRCIVADRCSYPYLFETAVNNSDKETHQDLPHPFVLAPPLKTGAKAGDYQSFLPDEEMVFDLVLMGNAIDYLPYIVYSISKMAEKGFGLRVRNSFRLCEVVCLDSFPVKSIYDRDTEQLSTPDKFKTLAELVAIRESLIPKTNIDKLTLKFLSPTRIRLGGKLQNNLSFSILVKNLVRRISLLAQTHNKAAWQLGLEATLSKLAEDVQIKSNNLEWWDFERFSNRQRTSMKLGGFVGEIEYQSPAIAKFLPLLLAGEILHIGGSTSFGLGKYQVNF